MIEICPYWPEEKFTEKKLCLNDICGTCGKQTKCNVIHQLAKNPDIVKQASGGFRKPKPKFNTPYRVICKDCNETTNVCRCRRPSGYTLKEVANGQG